MRDLSAGWACGLLAALGLAIGAAGARAGTAVLCQIVADADTAEILLESGRCDRRVTPASTFKLALAVMAGGEGLIAGGDAPALSWQPGDPDWGGPAWRGRITPRLWMRHSVVWYSQRLTARMGRARLETLARDLAYGNADFSGDAGHDNGLERAWIASSLKISPREQLRFLSGLVTGGLPAPAAAQALARDLLPVHVLNGWVLRGKTGGAYPRRPDRSFDRKAGIGWYVGWAVSTRSGRRLVFVRLTQDSTEQRRSPGLRARDALLADWPALAAPLQ